MGEGKGVVTCISPVEAGIKIFDQKVCLITFILKL